MSKRPLLTALLLLSACGDDDSKSAHSQLDGSLLDGSVLDAFVPDGGAGDARVVPSEHPAQLQVRFDTGGCYGDCPVYTVSIDQGGQVQYQGGLCTARPGVFTKQVPSTDVYDLYAKLWHAGYWDLQDRYLGSQDGCPGDVEDVSTQTLRVDADGVDKSLQYKLTCTGFAALDAVRALAADVQDTAQVAALISADSSGAALFDCGSGYAFPLELTGSYRLTYGDRAIGILSLAGSRADWKLVDCSGQPISMGRPVMEPKRWLLLDEGRHAITLPLDAGTVGSIVLSPAGDAGFSARGIRLDDELVLTATPGTSCTP